MKGAEILMMTARDCGIDLCLANPGTTEIPLVTVFDGPIAMRPLLGLFEGVCTGAADGYARMTDRPAMALLHLGPGFANGIANLHNARRAKVPLLVIVGDHATWHRDVDPPLAMDIEGLARPVSAWVRTNRSPEHIARDTAEAISATLSGRIATLIVPHDYLLAETEKTHFAAPRPSFDPIDPAVIEEAGHLLRTWKRAALLLGGRGARGKGVQAAARIQAATGCDLFAETFPACVERGAGLPDVERIPYFPEPARERLSAYDGVVLAGLNEPVTFFGYEGIPSRLFREDQKKHPLVGPQGDVVEALEKLVEAVGGAKADISSIVAPAHRPEAPEGALTAEKACITLAALQPEDAIIVDEGITSAFAYYPLTRGVPRHHVMAITGGSIGYGMPCALGAALACPDRPVINLQADGSAMYTVQTLWTQAREGCNVTTLICSNRGYNVVRVELARAGVTSPGPRALSLTEIANPPVDWPALARSLGVPGVTVERAEDLARELSVALSEPGPHLVEMKLSPASQ